MEPISLQQQQLQQQQLQQQHLQQQHLQQQQNAQVQQVQMFEMQRQMQEHQGSTIYSEYVQLEDKEKTIRDSILPRKGALKKRIREEFAATGRKMHTEDEKNFFVRKTTGGKHPLTDEFLKSMYERFQSMEGRELLEGDGERFVSYVNTKRVSMSTKRENVRCTKTRPPEIYFT